MKHKIHPKALLLGSSVTIGFILFCIVAMHTAISINHQGIRTTEECNQLQGMMKDDPEVKDFLQTHPDRANVLRKDDCLEGLKIIGMGDNSISAGIYVAVPIGLVIGFAIYLNNRPDNLVNSKDTIRGFTND